MRYRELGKTGLSVSEIGLGGEWLERHNAGEVKAVIDRCEELGINILDCWMSEPEVRSKIGARSQGRGSAGSSRDIWDPRGRTGSMCVPGIWSRYALPSRIFLTGWERIILIWA